MIFGANTARVLDLWDTIETLTLALPGSSVPVGLYDAAGGKRVLKCGDLIYIHDIGKVCLWDGEFVTFSDGILVTDNPYGFIDLMWL